MVASGKAERSGAEKVAKILFYVHFLWRREKNEKRHPPSPRPLPYMEGMQLIPGRNRPTSKFLYGSQSLCPYGVSHGFFIA